MGNICDSFRWVGCQRLEKREAIADQIGSTFAKTINRTIVDVLKETQNVAEQQKLGAQGPGPTANAGETQMRRHGLQQSVPTMHRCR